MVVATARRHGRAALAQPSLGCCSKTARRGCGRNFDDSVQDGNFFLQALLRVKVDRRVNRFLLVAMGLLVQRIDTCDCFNHIGGVTLCADRCYYS